MSLPSKHIIRHLFQVESLEEVSLQQLEELVETYPSFGVGRYLLSSKLQTVNADHFKEETQKTNLYFTNPFWLQWLLQEEHTQSGNGETEIPAEEVFAPAVDPTEATIDTGFTPQAEPDEVGEQPVEGPAPTEQTSPAAAPPSAADELMKSIAELRDQRQAEQAVAAPEEAAPSMGIASLALEQLEEPGQETDVMHPAEHPPVEGSASTEELIPTQGPALTEEFTPTKEPALTEEPAPTEQPQPTAEISGPAPKQDPIFEPYHTVDYFASQGIRLVQEENPSDKLGRQLKSFTDWLKVMRKLPQKNREIIPDIAAERQVQAIAAHSIEGKEVVTEAMAEVLAKQGMREKATEMYRKLSLLEPEKSAYFADKIEKLKIV